MPTDPALKNSFYIEPTIFADVTPKMRIASEEIFGPVLSVFKWDDERRMIEDVNGLRIRTDMLHLDAGPGKSPPDCSGVEAGFVWINKVSKHFIGAPFGGVKQSGIGCEKSLEELLSFTHEKNVHVILAGQ